MFCFLHLSTTEEITGTLTGTIIPSDLERGPSNFVRVNTSLPPSLDWRDEGLVTEVKMQVRLYPEVSVGYTLA